MKEETENKETLEPITKKFTKKIRTRKLIFVKGFRLCRDS